MMAVKLEVVGVIGDSAMVYHCLAVVLAIWLQGVQLEHSRNGTRMISNEKRLHKITRFDILWRVWIIEGATKLSRPNVIVV